MHHLHMIDLFNFFFTSERAHQMGQDVTKIPYEDRSWGTSFKTRTNATLSRNFGLDMKQLNLQGRISNNHSGDVSYGRLLITV